MPEMWINMGPQHPATHGLWDLRVKVDGETVLDADPSIGYIHRGIEKLCEHRTYNQIIPLMDRTGYVSSMSWAIMHCIASEEVLGVEVPPRAQWIRVISFELQRIASHLLFVSGYAENTGLLTVWVYATRDREFILDLFQMLSGARMHYNYPRVGGVRWDLPPGFAEQTRRALDHLEARIPEYEAMTLQSKVFRMRSEGVAVLRREDALRLGVTGPNLRASGVREDVRLSDPSMPYDQFDFDVPTGRKGDCMERFTLRLEEIRQSARIVRQALESIPEGPVMARVGKKIVPPPGEAYARVEDPRGEAAEHIISDGSERPYRVKLRSPVFCTMSALPVMLRGVKLADVPPVMESIDLLIGETDR
ncbi:MAG: NADH-quinone oxidoreductase subunit D [Euryarchaeota archaeon]|nr:NADH-quinone oxidoreductase subunit D [Euryarchaeota archaeon]